MLFLRGVVTRCSTSAAVTRKVGLGRLRVTKTSVRPRCSMIWSRVKVQPPVGGLATTVHWGVDSIQISGPFQAASDLEGTKRLGPQATSVQATATSTSARAAAANEGRTLREKGAVGTMFIVLRDIVRWPHAQIAAEPGGIAKE